MGTLDGNVAFITGAARGQGRSHAIRLAEEGADIIALDICKDIASVPYPLATPEDLEQTVQAVTALGRRIVAREGDVRDERALQAAFDDGVAELGPVDIVVANAGIAPLSTHEAHEAFRDTVDVNLTGTFNAVEIAIPSMISRGKGGVIVLISSTTGITGVAGPTRGGLAYSAAKHGIVGLMRTYATNLAPHSIRVNTVHPTGVRTPMTMNDAIAEFIEGNTFMANALRNALPVELIEPEDVSAAVAWLVSDQARYVTGVVLPVDAGFANIH
jgi:SDR family mycofactocin-dependent oxidoreductase